MFSSKAGNENQYELRIQSDHMSSGVTNKSFNGSLRDNTNVQQQYVTTFKKEVFLKFFHCLKLAGAAKLKVSSNAKLEMEFKYEKCQ